MRDTLRGLAFTTWTSGTRTSRAIPRPPFSTINASSARTGSPIRERWRTGRGRPQRPAPPAISC
uniref:Uncharacterized protein n=1 Tax=Anguilla anguilla TaxID=7936 RepID=A0A0E9S813_ANGAN